jgi:hypothetical protein
MGELLRQFDRPQIGEQAEFLAEAEQRGAFGAFFLGNGGVAVRQAHAAKENAIRVLAELERCVRQGLAGGVNARPADGRLGDFQGEREFFLDGAEDLYGLAHHFGADAVAGQRGDFEIHGTHVALGRLRREEK